MPLSARRSYRKSHASSLVPSEPTAADFKQTNAGSNSTENRPARRSKGIPIGFGLTVGLIILVALINVDARLRSLRQDTPRHATASPTSPIHAGLLPESPSPALAVQTAPAIPIPTEYAMPVDGASSSNPWVGHIPEAACIPADLPETGRVVEVLNGDTIKVLMDRDARVYSIRYLGVQAPRLSPASALGKLALERNVELVYGQQVVLVRDITDTDPSGTLLRYVMTPEVFVNLTLVQDGWGQVEMSSPDTACLEPFRAAEQQAQREKHGMWGEGTPPTVGS